GRYQMVARWAKPTRKARPMPAPRLTFWIVGSANSSIRLLWTQPACSELQTPAATVPAATAAVNRNRRFGTLNGARVVASDRVTAFLLLCNCPLRARRRRSAAGTDDQWAQSTRFRRPWM